ncbi:XrtA/PEP-CTERM system TPR-repeat protein PrsT [Variovorax sp. HJSM1_2]|uniref:XrtA/PEP-CTERM system TPR-repeat protein PrsT n=1 Tax=Variovorax sp. HJSM1_2 TaxID=3366263 RepID=UPI003BC26308
MAVWLVCQASAAMAVTDSKASRFYEDALTRYEQRDMPGAIIQLKNALQIDKTMLPVQVLLGRALLANGEAVAAEVALTEALRLGVNRAEVVVPLAQAFMAQGKQPAVLERPQFNPAGLPTGVQVQMLLLRATAAADLGNLREALRLVDEARTLDPRSPDPWLTEVPIRVRERKFKEASDAVDRALALSPGLAEAQYQRGSVSHVQGDLAGAMAAYNQAIQAAPKHLEALIARAGLLMDAGKSAEALNDLNQAQRVSASEPRVFYLKALLAERAGDNKGAAAELRRVTAFLDPVPLDFVRYRPQILMLNGLAHYGLNELEKAKPYLDLFQRIQGTTPVTKLLAQIYLNDGDMVRATEVLEAYVRAQPADTQALTMLASAHMAQGHNAKAASLMQEALAKGDQPALRTVLGLSMIGGGRTQDGVAQLEAAYRKDPGQIAAGAALVSSYLRSGQMTKAVTVAEALAKRQPDSAAVQNLLGVAQAQKGNLAASRVAFEAASKLDPAFLAPQLRLARIDTNTKNFDAAATRLNTLLKANERDVDTMMELAYLADRRGQLDETVRWFDKAIAVSGARELRPALALVQLHLRYGRNAQALEVAKVLSGKAPDDIPVLLVYARAQLANGDGVGARPALSSATRLADFNAPLQTEIALLQVAAGNPGGASYCLDKALGSDPHFLPAMALRAEVSMRQGDLTKAEAVTRQILAQEPKRAVGYSLQGDLAMARAQPPAALEAYRKAHQLEPSSETLLRLFEATSRAEGKPALALLDQWIKANPTDKRVRGVLADTYASTEKYAQAKTVYENILADNPDDVSVLNNLANVLLRLKDPGAVRVAEKALALQPGNPNVIDTLAWALFQGGQGGATPAQSERALQLLRDARLRAPANPNIRYHLAVVLAQVGRKSEARTEVEAALATGPGWQYTAEAETLLKTLR